MLKNPYEIVSLSGGLDSQVLLASRIFAYNYIPGAIMAVSFSYGSKHNALELAAAKRIANAYMKWNVEHLIIDVQSVFKTFDSALLNGDEAVPEGHYEEESMRRTVVPGRNMIFAAILAGIAESRGIRHVNLGVHAGDHFIYPDCRPAFVNTMAQAVGFASENKVSLLAPFISLTKRDIVQSGLNLRVPFSLSRTCYTSEEVACGKCGSCQERLEAFKLNEAEDPLPYQSRTIFNKSK
jgi:7-cyano-7-deazaguanine synthase